MFFSEKDTLYASFDYAVALLNYKASRESELDHHVTVFRRFYWLRERKVLWLSPNPNDKIQNGRISDCTPDHMGFTRYAAVLHRIWNRDSIFRSL